MLIPAVAMIEMAADTLKSEGAVTLAEALREFNSLGDTRKTEIIFSLSKLPGLSAMGAGYLLGFETSRVMYAGGYPA